MNKNRILILTIFALMLLTAACGSKTNSSASADATAPSKPTVTSSAAATTKAADTTPASTPAETTGTPLTPTVSPPVSSENGATTTFKPDQDLDAILDKITNLEEGTAGASLKQAAVAGSLADWAEGTSLKQKSIEAQISYYIQNLENADAVSLLKVNFVTISNIVQLIVDGDSGTKASLAESGYKLAHSSYTQSKWDAVATAFQIISDAY